MDNQFLTSPRRGRVRVAVGITALLLLIGGAAVSRMTDKHARQRRPVAVEQSPVAPQAMASSSVVPSADASVEPSPVPLRLVRGARTVNGVSVGYPHTLAGAVSAYVEYSTQIISNLDLQRAVEIGAVISDGSYGPPDSFVQTPIGLRKWLGLPTSGPVPLGASVTFTPVAWQVRDVHPDEMTVLVLAYLTTDTQESGLHARTGVYPQRMVWSGGDWKAAKRPAGASDYTELRVEPATEEAARAGWLDFLQ